MLFKKFDLFAGQDLTLLLARCRLWATQLQSAVQSLITGTGTGPGTQNCTTVFPELQVSKEVCAGPDLVPQLLQSLLDPQLPRTGAALGAVRCMLCDTVGGGTPCWQSLVSNLSLGNAMPAALCGSVAPSAAYVCRMSTVLPHSAEL